MQTKKFYRVCHVETGQGLWYDRSGTFTGLIHNEFSFCKNKDLPMPEDESIKGWLSTTDNLEDLFFWFSKEDILKLEKYDYQIHIYDSNNYKQYLNHWLVEENSVTLSSRQPINNLYDI